MLVIYSNSLVSECLVDINFGREAAKTSPIYLKYCNSKLFCLKAWLLLFSSALEIAALLSDEANSYSLLAKQIAMAPYFRFSLSLNQLDASSQSLISLNSHSNSRLRLENLQKYRIGDWSLALSLISLATSEHLRFAVGTLLGNILRDCPKLTFNRLLNWRQSPQNSSSCFVWLQHKRCFSVGDERLAFPSLSKSSTFATNKLKTLFNASLFANLQVPDLKASRVWF